MNARASRWRIDRVVGAAAIASEHDERGVTERRRVPATDHRRLVREHGARRTPTVVDRADDVLGGNAHVGEEHLVEVRGAGDLSERSDVDAWVCRSSSSNVMPRCFGTSGFVRARRIAKSHRCAFDVHTFWPLTTNSSPSRTGARREVREIAARARFAEQLAPRLVGAQERAEVARPLLGVVP